MSNIKKIVSYFEQLFAAGGNLATPYMGYSWGTGTKKGHAATQLFSRGSPLNTLCQCRDDARGEVNCAKTIHQLGTLNL
jgi:hypothetical protein